VDHSIIAYLLNPEGEFVAFYGQEELAATMIPKVENQIWEYRKRAFWKSVGLL
jgi:cytochrome oxidase Cu insertion factor (SCO1/SenC/PrrC family)